MARTAKVFDETNLPKAFREKLPRSNYGAKRTKASMIREVVLTHGKKRTLTTREIIVAIYNLFGEEVAKEIVYAEVAKLRRKEKVSSRNVSHTVTEGA